MAVQSVVPLERPIMRLPRGLNRLVPLLSRRMLRMILGELSELRQRARLLPHIPVWIKDENNLNINYLILFSKFSKDPTLLYNLGTTPFKSYFVTIGKKEK